MRTEQRASTTLWRNACLLFVGNKVRRDIQTTVAFLTTRVKKPDQDNWGKLRRLLKYLKGTKRMELMHTIDNVNTIRWWVDASYNLHDHRKGQTGAMMMMGKGAPIIFSRKQKLNVRSSCEGELVGIDDAMPDAGHPMAIPSSRISFTRITN